MDPTEKDIARFYCNFKIHKKHKHGEAPPPRPIVSGNNSMTEAIGKYVEHKIKDVAKQHDTYIEDTPDFLRTIANIDNLEGDKILASIDVKALFTNIPKKEGLNSLRNALGANENKELIVKLMELILNNNLFSFHEGVFRQDIGGAMGSLLFPPIPTNSCQNKLMIR